MQSLPRILKLFMLILLCMFPTAAALASDKSSNIDGDTTTPTYQQEIFAEGIAFPWSMSFLPDGRSLVTSRFGQVWLLDEHGAVLNDVTPDIPELWVDRQAGLFEIALSPNFLSDQTVFLSYACGTLRANNTCLGKGFWNGQAMTNFHVIFSAYPRKTGSAHYGGRVAFLPDHTLLLTLGDGFDYREDAQRIENHIGSVVRLEFDGTVPTDNPFVANETARPEIFTYGHRNVQGIAWHPEREAIFISEHGPRGGDEINRLQAGQNYGWPLITGGKDYTGARISPYRSLPGLIGPEFEWTPGIAPSGLMVYQGNMFSEWRGDLLVPALAARQVSRMRYEGGQLQQLEILFSEIGSRIRYILEHPTTGALYLLTDEADGKIVKITRP